MIAFVNNIISWVTNNWPGILATLSTIDLAGLITAIVVIRKGSKNTADNTNSTVALNKSIEENTKLNDELKVAIKDNEIMREQMKELENSNGEMVSKLEDMSKKMSSILDVMSLAYSTIKDGTIRNAINNIITDAKYAASTTRAELEQQVHDLENAVKKETEQVLDSVKNTVDKVKNLVNPGNVTTVRY